MTLFYFLAAINGLFMFLNAALLGRNITHGWQAGIIMSSVGLLVSGVGLVASCYRIILS